MDFNEQDEFQPEEASIAIYSKWAILGFSIFFSPMVGSILLMLNLRRAGNKKAGYGILLFGIFYTVLAEILFVKLSGLDFTNASMQKLIANPRIFYYSKAFDILGAGILAEYFFKRYFPDKNYETRSFMPPLIIIILIVFMLSSLV